MDLSVVIPVHNEADNVQPLLDEIEAALEGRDHEVIFVDDGSDDGTLERLRELLAATPSLRVLRHRERCGQSAALRTGLRAARAPWVATLDGDGQNDPADIARLEQALRAWAGASTVGLVAGLRARRHDNWLRRASSRIANRVRNAILADGVADTGCGLKLIRREVFEDLPAFDHMHRFLPALVRRAGAAVITAPVGHRPRLRGRSKYGVRNRLWVGIVDLLGVWWLKRRALRPRADVVEPAAAAGAGAPDRCVECIECEECARGARLFDPAAAPAAALAARSSR